MAIGVGSFAALLVLEHLVPKLPATIVVVAVSVLLVSVLSLEDRGVAVVGEIPSGFDLLPWGGVTASDIWALLPGALAIVVVGFAQSLAIVKAYAAQDHTPVDANRELMAYGLAALGAGALQGFPPAGSLSKSAAAERARARTAMAFAISAGLVVLTILFLTGFFANLPEAALGAVVIHAVSGMIKPLKIWGLHQIRVPDFWLALVAFLGVVVIGVMAGIVIGVLLSMILLLQRLSRPHTAVIGWHPNRGFVDIATYPDAEQTPGTLIFRVDGPLVFASVDGALEILTSTLDATPTRPELVVLDLSACYEIDVTAADALAALTADLRREGIEIRFAGAHRPIRDYAARLTLAALTGLENPYPTVQAALADRDQPRARQED